MRTRLTALLSIATVALLATTAAAQGKTRECADGTTSTAGRGACSGHGGLKKVAKDTKTDAKAAAKEAKTEAKAAAKVAKTEAKADKKETKPVQVKCVDGAMSKAGRGACSGHGGVAKG